MVRQATADDLDELMRLAAVMFDAIDVDSSGADWRDSSRALLPAGFDAATQAAFVVDHPDGAGGLVASAAGSVMQALDGEHPVLSGRAVDLLVA